MGGQAGTSGPDPHVRVSRPDRRVDRVRALRQPRRPRPDELVLPLHRLVGVDERSGDGRADCDRPGDATAVAARGAVQALARLSRRCAVPVSGRTPNGNRRFASRPNRVGRGGRPDAGRVGPAAARPGRRARRARQPDARSLGAGACLRADDRRRAASQRRSSSTSSTGRRCSTTSASSRCRPRS